MNNAGNNLNEMTREERDNIMVEEAFRHLLDTYLQSRHRKKVELITKAFNFARQAHKGVRRLSGEPYIMHPIAVAQIACGEIGLGSTSICAALLHDVVEDTDYTVEDIENIFGPKIAQIVDGLTKISGGIFGEKASAQAESFKKLLLTMSDDIRVILIKMSDRLHNMRTLGSQRPNKQYKIAGETLYIYAPLANRLGLYKIKEELEDLSFSYEHPEEYLQIKNKLEDTREHLNKIFEEFVAPIAEQLDNEGVTYEIKQRIKSPYSIWRKMQTKHIPFEEVYDILAVRIIFKPKSEETEIDECFHIFNMASRIYKTHPERLRDWLHHPKANGYQALHTTLMSKIGRWIEVQIRSERMNEIAEQGFAAHWKYKDGGKTSEDSENELNKWLQTIKEILDDPQPNALDFLDTIKLNLYSNEIFVVTPKGDFKTMPAGCSVLDFAFSIHTILGTHCIGAKVNHVLVPISHTLKSGDQVEVLTGKEPNISAEWLNFITTAKARGKIMASLRKEKREYQRKGEQMLIEFLRQNDREASSLNIEKLTEEHQKSNREELFAGIGSGEIVLGDTDMDIINGKDKRDRSSWTDYLNIFKSNKKKSKKRIEADTKQVPITVDTKKPIILNESTISHFMICECCQPIPGDAVLGYFDTNNRITIHKRQCPVAAKLKATGGNHILSAEWDTHHKLFFPATIQVCGIDHVGVLHQMTDVMSRQLNMNIRHLEVNTDDGLFTANIQMEVHDVDDVKKICRDLKQIEEVQKAVRIK